MQDGALAFEQGIDVVCLSRSGLQLLEYPIRLIVRRKRWCGLGSRWGCAPYTRGVMPGTTTNGACWYANHGARMRAARWLHACHKATAIRVFDIMINRMGILMPEHVAHS